jgi:hypothetical protein
MRHTSVIFSLFIVITILSGCASLSKEECLDGDWERIGYADGAAGRSASRIHDHKKACTDYKIAPDITAYRVGRATGLEQVYCKPRNAYRIGLSGYSYNNVCPSYMKTDFLDAYRYGKEIHHLKKDAKGLHVRLQHIDTEIEQLDQKIGHLDNRIHSYRTHRGSPRIRIRHHLTDELDQYVAKIEEKTQGLIKILHLSKIGSHALDDLVTLSSEKGRYQDKLNWLNEYGHYSKPDHGQRKKLNHRLDDLSRQIHHQQKIIGMARRSQEQRKKILRLLSISEYTGELSSQLKMLQRLDNRDQVKNLIRFHYAHEPDYVSRHSDRNLLHDQPQKSVFILRSELRNAQQERDRLLLERHDVEHQIKKTGQDIEHMKRNNIYR